MADYGVAPNPPYVDPWFVQATWRPAASYACAVGGSNVADYGVPPNPPYVDPWFVQATWHPATSYAWHPATSYAWRPATTYAWHRMHVGRISVA